MSELQDISTAYLTKAEALTNLHIILGHLPYARIEKLIKKGIFYNVSIDVKLLKSLLLARCDICLRAKITENAHKGNLKIPTQSWRSFSTDISASFDQPSIEGNNYQMAIIDNFTKFIWD